MQACQRRHHHRRVNHLELGYRFANPHLVCPPPPPLIGAVSECIERLVGIQHLEALVVPGTETACAHVGSCTRLPSVPEHYDKNTYAG